MSKKAASRILSKEAFKNLQGTWYAKLAKTGFSDIEDSQERLKTWHSHWFRTRGTPAQLEYRQDYYLQAEHFLQTHKFKRIGKEKHIWKLHAQGKSAREIVRQLKITEKRVLLTIKKLMVAMVGVRVRAVREIDKAFIYSTWLKGQYYGNELYRAIPDDVFYKNYTDIINQILTLPNTVIRVACLPDDPEVILGYIVESDKTVLHWLFVKQAWRGQGIAKKLLSGPYSAFTGFTEAGAKVMKKLKVPYNPWIMSNNSSKEG